MRFRLLLPAAAAVCAALAYQPSESARWEQQARGITIVRDDWGIAHIYGKTDADAVFGAIYAQAEDDFNRVETNYINAMGRLAEAEGESKIWQDLRMKLFMDPAELKTNYAESPAWMQKLMNAWADGLNYYLLKHPEVKPRVLRRFEPWMALSFTEGSIGGDIETINIGQLEAFYGRKSVVFDPKSEILGDSEPRGSNGIAVAPSNTAAKRALLLINPHTSFFFRSELQMVSEEGLNVYGASTWGQFFIYQGFNDRAGWMHTSSGVDAIDEYLETVTKKGNAYVYQYGSEERRVRAKEIVLPYRGGERKVTAYFTHHGPIVREANGKWVAVRLMHEPVKALQQSYRRTKARNYEQYRKTMELQANSSNNTIYADADGTIAYWHGNFIPVRDTRFDWTKPVDGSDPATEWKGLTPVAGLVQLKNPKVGWLYNANDWPWAAAGPDSPRRDQFPAYVDEGGPSARGRHAVGVLEGKSGFTVDSLIAAAYDSYLPWFEKTIPALIKAWDAAPASALKTKTAEQVAVLRKWDMRWGADSVATSVAVFWGEAVRARVRTGRRIGGEEAIAALPGEQLLEALASASDKLAANFGTWQTPWGEINRFQRITGDIVHPFDDAKPSIPVGFTSATWGSLASFGARAYPQTKKWYGTSGNSFVAVVEFGDRVRAKAVSAGGESGHPGSKHFDDQAQRYAAGNLRDVYFYREQLKGHTEREYHPGQ